MEEVIKCGDCQHGIEIFKNERFGEVRVAGTSEQPLFCALDICRALGYSNGRDAISKHVECEDVAKCDTPTKSGIQSMTYVNESGLYALIFGSKQTNAKIFKKWVTSEVLPSIRKTGQYSMSFQVPRTFAEALRLAAEQQEKIEAQQKLIEVQTPKVEFYDDIVESKDAMSMDRVAKTLNMGIGRNKLFELLRNKNILMRNNTPYQKYVDNGWFRCIESKFSKPNGDVCINVKTVVLQKGVDAIRRIVKNSI